MFTERIKTSHQLADTLEELAKVLRMLPEFEMPLDASRQSTRESSVPDRVQKRDIQAKESARLTELADKLPGLNRQNAEDELNTLTLPALRLLAESFRIRIPSRATKSESVRTLLEQVFDLPSGQELLSTFHKRNSRTSDSRNLRAAKERQLKINSR